MKDPDKIRIPENWPVVVKSAVLYAASMIHAARSYSAEWCADSLLQRMKWRGVAEKYRDELICERTVSRILGARLALIPARNRPHYDPHLRFEILTHMRLHGWTVEYSAKTFFVEPNTISNWLNRVDEQGPDAPVQLPSPVNKFPDFVRLLIRQFKAVCPDKGRNMISEIFGRAGLHVAASTIRRICREKPTTDAANIAAEPHFNSNSRVEPGRTVTATYPDHVWHIDLTTIPIVSGFSLAWFPFSLPQRWPFCWWTAWTIDHVTRRVVAFAVFPNQPSFEDVKMFLEKAIKTAGRVPKHIISDKGGQFWCDEFKKWCRLHGLKPRFGAVGRSGSIAVIERFIGTMKREGSRLMSINLFLRDIRNKLNSFACWYNAYRPHKTLRGQTPFERYRRVVLPANRRPRFEPRSRWPAASVCAMPQAKVRGNPGVKFRLDVSYLDGHRNLPVVKFVKAA